MRELDGRQDALHAWLFRVFGQRYVLQVRPERRCVCVVFEFLHPDMRREEFGIEDDTELLVGRPILRRRERELRIADPFPGARDRWIEPDMNERRVLQVFETRGGLAERDRQGRKLQLLFERRDRDR